MLYKIKVLVGSEIRTKHMKAMWYLNQPLDFKRLRQLQGVSSIVLVSTAEFLYDIAAVLRDSIHMKQVPAKVGV
jgi:hypothetical protein